MNFFVYLCSRNVIPMDHIATDDGVLVLEHILLRAPLPGNG